MKILLTGGSSFTGYWFVSELARGGHDVTAVFRGEGSAYDGVRGARVGGLADLCRREFSCSFGDDRFKEICAEGGWDVLCHHGAEVGDYRSPDFDVAGALAGNTRNLRAVLENLSSGGCRRVVLTGSVFEQREGKGSDGLPAFSPYGLSKGFTSEVFEYQVPLFDMRLGKFVIPNPFGPFEEPRFTAYLIRTWAKGETPEVRTPDYVRDNIHVSLLALAYRAFTECLGTEAGLEKTSPSGYLETQGEFTLRFAKEMEPRLGIPCAVTLGKQTEFTEPMVRTGADPVDHALLGWDEVAAWDGVADYYREQATGG